MAAAQVVVADDGPVLVLRVLKANLITNIEFGGKMDPFVEVRSVQPDGHRHKIAQTHTDWNGHFTPQFDYTCRGHPFQADEVMELRVLEDDMIGKADLCGAGTIKVADLFADVQAALQQVSTGKEFAGPIKSVPIEKKGKNEGSVTVQAILAPADFEAQDQAQSLQPSRSKLMTIVPEDMFITPVQRLGVSGGTAPFFKLLLENPARGQRETYYIGKDLSRAQDEIDFYEQVQQIKASGEGKAESLLFAFMFQYAGVFKCLEDRADDLITAGSAKTIGSLSAKASTKRISMEIDKELELLVLRNLHDGCSKLRMLDIKIGQKTAQAGWQGKSTIAALRQSVIDGITTSSAQGFRLEGFDGEPSVLTSMDPLLDFGGSGAKSKATKKAKRVMLQRMSASEMMMHLLDLTDLEAQHAESSQGSASSGTIHPAEYGEIVLSEMVARLLLLAMACRHCPVPQKWIGSSVALGFDCGELPSRSKKEARIRSEVRVSIFDWGRSELNTLRRHAALSENDRLDRAKFWSYYCGGIDRLAWEATRAYYHKFANAVGWGSVLMRIHDFDSASANDYIGQVYLPSLSETPQTTVQLTRKDNKKQLGAATLTYSLEYVSLPATSRLAGVWRIHITSAAKIPNKDALMLQSTSDPFVEVIAVSKDKAFKLREQTAVVVSSLDPVWNATIDLPVARSLDAFHTAVGAHVKEAFAAEQLAQTVLVSEEPAEPTGKSLSDSARDKAMTKWISGLDAAATKVSTDWLFTATQALQETATDLEDLEAELETGIPLEQSSGFSLFTMCNPSRTSEGTEGAIEPPRVQSEVTKETPLSATYHYVPAKEVEDVTESTGNRTTLEGVGNKEAQTCPCLCQ